MQFNYIETMISQSPLDFNYKFGINDNSPDKFRCDNITIMTNTFNTDSVKSYVNGNYSLDLFTGLDNEDTYDYDISYVDSSFSNIDDMSMLSLEKKDNVEYKETNISISSIINQANNSFNQMSSFTSSNDLFSQGVGTFTNIFNLGLNIFNLVQTINQSKNLYNSTKASVDAQISLLNEMTESNREFIQTLKDRKEQNRLKYVSVSQN